MSKKRIALIVLIIAGALGLGIAAALSPSVMAAVEPFMALFLVIGLGAYAVAHTMVAVSRFRERQYGLCALWLVVALIQAVLAIATLDWVFTR
jgi:hypothetical protein